MVIAMGQQTSKNSYWYRLSPVNLKKPSLEKKEGFLKYKTRKNSSGIVNTPNLFGFKTIKSLLGGVNPTNPTKNETILPNTNNNSDYYETEAKHTITNNTLSSKKSKRRKKQGHSGKKGGTRRTYSDPNLSHDHKKSRGRCHRRRKFGYEIQNVEEFLAKATLQKPANIPVVLAFASVLYQTKRAGRQSEISLPLGMVVNAVFKNQHWLYVQTPHAEEGYISYSVCLPLGIIPTPEDDDHASPCWEKSTDVFPKPSGNVSDKVSCKSADNDYYYCTSASKYRNRTALSTCGERSVDRLYLRAAAIAKGKGTRHTLLVINESYKAKDSLTVSKNEVVFLLDATVKGWFYIRNKEGLEGYIPASIAGHGFL